MTAFLQGITMIIILVAIIGWGIWVHDTRRSIKTPEYLGEIFVHGVPEGESNTFSDAVTVGVAGYIAEHKRDVVFVNEAATRIEGDALGALTRVSRPAPTLLRTSSAPAALDISFEFAGSKIDAKGLQRFFSSNKPRRGALSISLLLEKKNNELIGLASSSFAPNSAYGFAMEVKGEARTIAQLIAMRFVQAHYATDDSFFAALTPDDFLLLWEVRRDAADIAVRASGSGTEGDESLRGEAETAYKKISHLVRRYTRRSELQGLGAYLASKSENYDMARTHLESIKADTADATEREKLKDWIEQHKTDAGQTGTTLATGGEVGALENAILEQPSFKERNLAAMTATLRTADPEREVNVVIVLGAFDEFEPFGDRVAPLSDQDHSQTDGLLAHTQTVASLVATLAPRAKIRVAKALEATGSGTNENILSTLERVAASSPDILVLPLGPFRLSAYQRIFQELTASGTFILAAAGNNGEEEKGIGSSIDGVVYVGASENGQLTSYTNFGSWVKLYTLGTTLTFDGAGKIEQRTGTSYSVAIAAAVAANIAAIETEKLSAAGLEEKLLLDHSELVDNIRVLRANVGS